MRLRKRRRRTRRSAGWATARRPPASRSSSAPSPRSSRAWTSRDITAMAKAYFDCVNDNGGINGRPIEYIVETEQTNPQQVASLATKLWRTRRSSGSSGNTSLLDCAVNQKFYEKNDIYVIAAGVPRECYFGAEHRAREHGAELLGARRRAGARPPGREVARRGDRQGSRARTTTTRACSSSPRRTTSRARASSSRCRSPTARRSR